MNSFIAALLLSYLIGSVPIAYLVSMAAKKRDPRLVGDGNPGARNVYRHISHSAGWAIALLDIAKGAVAILLGKNFGLGSHELYALGFAVVIGHNWPVFLRFQGGQGMAATYGVLLAISPRASLVGLAIFGLGMLFLHNWDYSCAIGFGMIPLVSYFWDANLSFTIYSVFLIPMMGIRKIMQQAWGWSSRGRHP